MNAACSCINVFSGGKFSCSCSDLDVMWSALHVLVMNLTALFCVRCSESRLVLAIVWIGTAGYIRAGRMRVVYSLSLFRVLRCLNLFSFVRLVLAIAFLMFTWFLYPCICKVQFQYFPFCCVWVVVVSYYNVCCV